MKMVYSQKRDTFFVMSDCCDTNRFIQTGSANKGKSTGRIPESEGPVEG
jgi:hypothetical protein